MYAVATALHADLRPEPCLERDQPLPGAHLQLLDGPGVGPTGGERSLFAATSRRVSEGTRTPDRLDHNQELYQLSYAHRAALRIPARRYVAIVNEVRFRTRVEIPEGQTTATIFEVPVDLRSTFGRARPPLVVTVNDPVAQERFEAMSYSHRREYVEWVCEARRPETRGRRIAACVDRVRAGRPQR